MLQEKNDLPKSGDSETVGAGGQIKQLKQRVLSVSESL